MFIGIENHLVSNGIKLYFIINLIKYYKLNKNKNDFKMLF